MRQNATTPPQQFLFDNGTRKQLTNNEDLFPDLTRMVVQRFEVKRADGFTFRTIVYLPSDYKEGTRLPGFFWFYPYRVHVAGGVQQRAERRRVARVLAERAADVPELRVAHQAVPRRGSATPSSRTSRRSSARPAR